MCSCSPGYIGTPPGCRPECTASSECASNKACVNQKCQNPCPSPCGSNTDCIVRNHSPYCVCKQGFTGEPFSSCFPVTRKKNYNLDQLFIWQKLNNYRLQFMNQQVHLSIHVCLRHVAFTQNVETIMVLHHVHVYKII